MQEFTVRKSFGLVEFITLFVVLGAFSCLMMPYLPFFSPKAKLPYYSSFAIKFKWFFVEKPEVQALRDLLVSSLETYRSAHGKNAIPPSLDVFEFPQKARRISASVIDFPLSVVSLRAYGKNPHLSIEVGPYRKTRRHWQDGTEGYEIVIPLVGDSTPRCLGMYNACHNRFKCLNPHAPKDGWLDICLLGDRL